MQQLLDHREKKMSGSPWVEQSKHSGARDPSSWPAIGKLFLRGMYFIFHQGEPQSLVTYSECSRALSSQVYIYIPHHRRCRRPHCGSCTCGCSWGPSEQEDKLKHSIQVSWLEFSISTQQKFHLSFHISCGVHQDAKSTVLQN